MGSGGSILHEDDYKHFLTLGPVVQQEWLRRIPASEINDFQGRIHELPPNERNLLLALLRQNAASRQSSRDLASRGGENEPQSFGSIMPSRGLMAEARRPYVDRTSISDEDSIAMTYSKGDYESAPPTPAKGDRGWRSPVALVPTDDQSAFGSLALGSHAGASGSGASKESSSNQEGEVELTPEELLEGMIATQIDAGLGQVIVLNLVGVELNLNMVELKAVFTPFIQAINLGRNPGLSGNLSTVSDCVGLYDLCLEVTGVEGDLSSLQKCKKLHKVLLSDLKVTGDIAVFAPCHSLKKVWLRCTQVRGDIGVAFAISTLLVDVLLRRTKVYGDISVFGHCKRLHNIALSRTGVSGHVDNFRGLHALRVLALEFCGDIEGDRDEIERALPLCKISF